MASNLQQFEVFTRGFSEFNFMEGVIEFLVLVFWFQSGEKSSKLHRNYKKDHLKEGEVLFCE